MVAFDEKVETEVVDAVESVSPTAAEGGKGEAADDGLQAASTSDSFYATNPGEASTSDSFFATNPGEVSGPLRSSGSHMATVAEEGELRLTPLALPEEDEEEQQPLDTARIRRMQQEAEMRAEHQAQARLTMLNLARALDDAHSRQREVQVELQQERDSKVGLNARIKHLEEKLYMAEEAEERRKAEELLRKGFESGNKLFLAMMLEKSREAYESNIYKEQDDDAASSADGGGGSSTAPNTARSAGGGSTAPNTARSAHGGLPVSGRTSLSGGHIMTEAERAEKRERRRLRSKERAKEAKKKHPFANTGDRVTFQWIMKLWLREAQNNKANVAKQTEDRKRQEEDDEKKRKMQEDAESKVKDMLRRGELLEKELDKANDTLEQYKRRVKVLERQIESLTAEAAEKQRELEATIAELRGQLEEAHRLLLEREAEIRRLKLELQAAHAKFDKAQTEMDVERRQLQDTIRKISTELSEATIMAKYMRETMLKSKRDAAASVSPAKFAELIAQLEEARDHLNALRKDYTTLQDDNTDLHSKLDKNRRRLELERQFLPLIRHARGPLGPKMGVNDIPMAAPASDQGSPELMKKLTKSKSAVSPATLKGHTLGVA